MSPLRMSIMLKAFKFQRLDMIFQDCNSSRFKSQIVFCQVEIFIDTICNKRRNHVNLSNHTRSRKNQKSYT